MAIDPNPEIYNAADDTEITAIDFGTGDAGSFVLSSTGVEYHVWNDKGRVLDSSNMTSVKMTTRDSDGLETSSLVTEHWVELKSTTIVAGEADVGSSGELTGISDDNMTEFQSVGASTYLSIGDIPSNCYRKVFVRVNIPTSAIEAPVTFSLYVTNQRPSTPITEWITGTRGNGIVATTGDPFAMSTTGATNPIPYNDGTALINSNEIYYGSSGSYDIGTTGSGVYNIYLSESGFISKTTGDIAINQLALYQATISSGVCTVLSDKRVYLSGLQAGTTGAMSTTPNLGNIYLDTVNGDFYGAKTAGTWTKITDAASAAPTAADISMSEIGSATYDNVQDWMNSVQSGGRISGGALSDDSSGGIVIASGTGLIKTTTGEIGLTKFFDWAQTSLVSTGLTNTSANYIYMDYNAGTPQILATATRTSVGLQDQFDLGRVYKNGTALHIINSGTNLYNIVRRAHERLVDTMGFQRASGGVITESPTTARALLSTIGKFYLGNDHIDTTAQNTSTGGSDYFSYHYYINGGWVSSSGQQQISNLYYNNTASTGLVALTANRYGVHWVYIHYDSDIQVVYGRGDYTLALAQEATLPALLPSSVTAFGILAAKVIVKQADTNFTSVTTAYQTPFATTTPPNHNDLGGLDSGDYQHLTATQDAGLNASEQTVATTTGTANISWAVSRRAYFLRSTGAAGAATFTFTVPNISADLRLIVQGSSAGSTGAITWPTVYWEAGTAPTLSTGISKIDKIDLYYSSVASKYLGKGFYNYSTV